MNMTDTESKKNRLLVVLALLSLVLIALLGYVGYTYLVDQPEEETVEIQEKVEETDNVLTGGSDIDIEPGEPDTVVYDEVPATEGATYFEKFEVIEGQTTYFAMPLEIDPANPPMLVVYSHGSNTRITTDLTDPFIQDMQMYGAFFTTNGYAFGASNQHGENWGNTESLNDTQYLIDWIKANYSIQERVNLLGFSMGGLPTLFYAMNNNDSVNAVALLAPTTYAWAQDKFESLAGLSIKVWHGTADVNIGYWVSELFVSNATNYGLNVPLRSVDGATHFDLDTEYKDEILEFYNQSGVRE